MLNQISSNIASIFVFLHGLVHLMGFFVYTKISDVQGLAYKTTLLGGRWDLGESGVRIFGFLWLVAAMGFAGAAVGLWTRQPWWMQAMLGVSIFSLILTLMDYSVSYVGAVINGVIIIALIILWRKGILM